MGRSHHSWKQGGNRDAVAFVDIATPGPVERWRPIVRGVDGCSDQYHVMQKPDRQRNLPEQVPTSGYHRIACSTTQTSATSA